MDKFWAKALSVTGPVAVVGFLLALFINRAFSEEVVKYFGSQNAFYLIIGILCVLGSALILSIFVYRNRAGKSDLISKSGSTVETKSATISGSRVDGDIVFGNKTTNKGGERE
ncbi:MAG: hypothetical protein IPM20_06790 [Gammaproteobacteria bacterium]|nr:hypothetical protein [Gammaproteobacteria bacterium]